jgi:hypothetical protein
LFSINSGRLLIGLYETQTLGTSYTAELHSGFIKVEVKEFILRMKNNKDTGYDGIPAKVWKVFRTMRDGTEILTHNNK